MRPQTGDRYSLRLQGAPDKVHMPSTRGGGDYVYLAALSTKSGDMSGSKERLM